MRFPARPLHALSALVTRHAGAFLIGGFALVAALAGAVVSTGNVILIALAIGAVAGVALLGAPAVTVTLIVIGVMVLSGPLVFYVPALDKIPWLFSVLGLVLAGSALLHAGLQRGPRRAPLPGFVVAALMFVLLALASAMWAEGPPDDTARGLKRVLQYWGLLIALALIAFPPRTVRRWALLLLGIALLQAPLAIYQRLVLVPSMDGAPIDAVVGSLELSQNGTGASGVLGLMQVCMIAALLGAYRERLLSAPWLIATLVMAFVPIAFGEVNAVFLWLPLALGVVFSDQLSRNLFRFVAGALATVAVIGALGTVYLIAQQTGSGNATPIDERIETLIQYNVGDIGYATKDGLNRKTVWEAWWSRHGVSDPKGTLIGHGVGSSFSSDEARGEVNRRNGSQLLDLVALTSVLWDLGVIGFGLFMAVFIGAGWRAHQLIGIAAPGIDRAMARGSLAAVVLIASSLLYNNAAVLMPSQQVFSFLVLGFIAWLDRRYARRAGGSPNKVS